MKVAKLVALTGSGENRKVTDVIDVTISNVRSGSGSDAIKRFLRGDEPLVAQHEKLSDEVEFETVIKAYRDPQGWTLSSHGLQLGDELIAIIDAPKVMSEGSPCRYTCDIIAYRRTPSFN